MIIKVQRLFTDDIRLLFYGIVIIIDLWYIRILRSSDIFAIFLFI